MNKKIVSIALASIIVLALTYSIIAREGHAQAQAEAVQVNPQSITWQYPEHFPGETFTIYIDVVNVIGLAAFQAGFRFDPTVLKVLSVAEGGFLSNNGADPLLSVPGAIVNANGTVNDYIYVLNDFNRAKTGSGHLLTIVMQINPALSPPYSGTYPGTPVMMANLTDTPGDPCQLSLIYQDGTTDITPSSDHIYDGWFTLSTPTQGPPEIEIIGLYPTNPAPYVASTVPRVNEPVIVKANVTGTVPNTVVLGFRKQGGPWFNTSMILNETDGFWTQTIPGQPENCTIEFQITANLGITQLTSAVQPYNIKALINGDINGDGVVDISDAAIIGLNWHKHTP